jgi:uncharacterized SAM-binding protein YcdF (DUF218 family)
MFFVASKTIGVLLVPSNFISFVGLLGLILWRTRYGSIGRKLVCGAVAAYLICGFSPVGNLLLVPLESRFPPWDAKGGEPDGIIVLGGAVDPDLSAARGVTVFGTAGDRMIAAASLAHRYPKARLVYTGGSANAFLNDTAKEADWASRTFEGLGIPPDRLVMERLSRNTRENAEFTKALVNPKPGERWLLLTSGYHMPRSMGIFRKVGFAVEAYPVDWKTRGPSDRFSLQNRFQDGMLLTDTAAREWLGLVAYRIAGTTDELFPSPVVGPTR